MLVVGNIGTGDGDCKSSGVIGVGWLSGDCGSRCSVINTRYLCRTDELVCEVGLGHFETEVFIVV